MAIGDLAQGRFASNALLNQVYFDLGFRVVG